MRNFTQIEEIFSPLSRSYNIYYDFWLDHLVKVTTGLRKDNGSFSLSIKSSGVRIPALATQRFIYTRQKQSKFTKTELEG